MRLEEFVSYIKSNAYYISNYWDKYKPELMGKIEMFIFHCQKDLKEENASLKAKVYEYEKIIANSNFAPILKDKESDK